MSLYENDEVRNLNKSGRSITIRTYLEILKERERITLEIFDILKKIRDTSETDEELGKNIKLFLKNR
jgi:hypothetical protein